MSLAASMASQVLEFRVVMNRLTVREPGLVGRRVVVGARSHLDRDCGGAVGHTSHGDFGAAHAHSGYAGVAGGGGNCAVARPGDRNRARLGGVVEGHARRVQGQASGGLSNAPAHVLGCGAAVVPLVVARRGEGGGVVAGIGAAGGASEGQFRRIIIGPGGALHTPGISERPALAGDNRDCSPADDPCNGLGRCGAVLPLIVCGRRKCGIVRPGIGASRCPA